MNSTQRDSAHTTNNSIKVRTLPVTRSSMPGIDEYIEQIRTLWDSRWLTNTGTMHEELTAKLSETLCAENLLLFSNGHMALELGLQALGLTGEVITTPYTFISTTQAIVRNGLTPVFCDIDPVTFAIDASKIEELITERTSAIAAVHVYGIPCDTDAIESIAKKHNLKVVYDAAHAFGVSWKGQSIARYGDLSMFSFHATKVFHTIEGGAVTCGDASLAEKLRHLRNFGQANPEDVDEFGCNGKLSEFHAAMGLCNLRHINDELQRRKAVSERYDSRLKDVKGLQLLPDSEGLIRNYAYYPVVVKEDFAKTRDKLFEELQLNGISTRKYFYPLTSAFSCYGGLPVYNTPVAEYVSQNVICLPMYADLSCSDIDRICGIVTG